MNSPTLRRRTMIICTLFLLLVILAPFAGAYSVPDDTIVYTTPTGECYHLNNCSYTNSATVHARSIADAEAAGYRPCSRCHPDYMTGSYGSSSSSGSSYSSGSSSPDRSVSPSIQTQVSAAAPEPEIIYRQTGLSVTLPIIAALLIYIAVSRRAWKRKLAAAAKPHPSPAAPAPSVPSAPASPAPLSPVSPPAPDVTVYVSPNGQCYHSYPGCSGAHRGIPLSMVGSRRPCSLCDPPRKHPF